MLSQWQNPGRSEAGETADSITVAIPLKLDTNAPSACLASERSDTASRASSGEVNRLVFEAEAQSIRDLGKESTTHGITPS